MPGDQFGFAAVDVAGFDLVPAGGAAPEPVPQSRLRRHPGLLDVTRRLARDGLNGSNTNETVRRCCDDNSSGDKNPASTYCRGHCRIHQHRCTARVGAVERPVVLRPHRPTDRRVDPGRQTVVAATGIGVRAAAAPDQRPRRRIVRGPDHLTEQPRRAPALHGDPGAAEAVGDLVDLPQHHRGSALMSAAGLPDLRPGPPGVDGDGDEALVGLGRPVDRHQQLLVVRRLQRPVMDAAAGPVPIQRVTGVRDRAFEDLEPADHRVLRAQLGQQRPPGVDPGAADRRLQQRERGTLESQDGGVGLRVRVFDHRDLDAVAAVDLERDQLQMGKIARQHEAGQNWWRPMRNTPPR